LVSWGLLINYAPGTDSVLEIEYDQPLVTSGPKLHLFIDIPNQPGVGDYPEIILINYPKQWQALTGSNPAVATLGALRYNSSGRDYHKIEIDFLKK